MIFDYFSPTDFKFAGIDVAMNKVVARPPDGAGLGHRRDRRRHRQRQVGHLLRPPGGRERPRRDRARQRRRSVLTKQLDPRWIDGQPYGFNMGLVGVGSNNSRGTLRQLRRPGAAAADDVREHRGLRRRRRRPLHRRPAPARGPSTGGRYTGTPAGGAAATSLMTPAGARAPATPTVDVDATVRLASRRLGRLRLRLLQRERLQVRRRSTSRPARSSSATGSGTSGSSTRRFAAHARRRRRLQARALAERHRRHRLAERRRSSARSRTTARSPTAALGTISRTGTTSFDNVHVVDRLARLDTRPTARRRRSRCRRT